MNDSGFPFPLRSHSVPTPFPLQGLPGAPGSGFRRPAGTTVPGGVPQTSSLTVIVVRVDGEKKA
jgi:hypothetical protein